MKRKARVHILRHTSCSRLAARNVPLLAIKEFAGHRALKTTMRYLHPAAAARRERSKPWRSGETSGRRRRSGRRSGGGTAG